jgi:hypothetical protein
MVFFTLCYTKPGTLVGALADSTWRSPAMDVYVSIKFVGLLAPLEICISQRRHGAGTLISVRQA